MLPEIIARTSATGEDTGLRLRTAFLNPLAFNGAGPTCTPGTAGCVNLGPSAPGQPDIFRLQVPAAEAVGSLIRGMSRQVGNELDEFITDSVRNSLVGLPLDLGAVNLARGRSEGVPSLNNARKQFYAATKNSVLAPYPNWFEFGLNLKYHESLANFVAAYGTDPLITGVPVCTTADGPSFAACGIKGRRAAAATLVA